MNRATLDSLNLIAGIDTVEITTDIQLKERIEGFATLTPLQACKKHGFLYKYKVNPDKVLDDAGNNIDKFKRVLAYVAECCKGATVLYMSRIDFRFDDYESEYIEGYKLNKLLLSLLAMYYGAKNRYTSADLLTSEELTARFEFNSATTHLSAEYYNKAKQEPAGNVKTRLELRSRQLEIPFCDGCDYESFILAEWLELLNAVITKENFDKVIKYCTESIVQRYEEKKGEFGNLTEFISCYRDSIFTSRQLTNLFGMLGNAETAKQNSYKYRNGSKNDSSRKLPCFSLADLKLYQQKLEQAALDFIRTQSEPTKVA